MQDLKIAIVQTELYWESPEANRATIEELISLKSRSSKLVVLPEMFSTGFTMDAPQVAEPMNFSTMKWMHQLAAQHDAVICGSLIIKEKKQFFNRMIWMRPDGSFEQYDKRHLFRMAEENEVYTQGEERKVIEIYGWTFCPLICYDLRFPVWSRNRNNEYDCLIYMANWPKKRRGAWKSLLKARAIENLSYCVGVNRIGQDGNEIEYSGDSLLFGPSGKKLLDTANRSGVFEYVLNREELDSYRTRFPAYNDSDDFEVK